MDDTKNINESFGIDTFERLEAIKQANGGSWGQNIVEAFEALAEQEGIEVEADA
jgi:hypothetical protein